MGLDYSFKAKNDSHESVCALTPSVSMPLWQTNASRPLAVPQRMLQSRKEYIFAASKEDAAPGAFLVHVTTDKKAYLGDIWISYDVSLMGTVFP